MTIDISPDGQRRGVLLVVLSGVFWSLQGATIRLVEDADAVQIVFWRGLSQFLAMLLVVTFASRGRVARAFRQAGTLALVGGLCVLCATTSFVFAIVRTTVANVVFIMASSPLFAAVGAWLFMRERVGPRTLAAMLVAVAGIGVMALEGLTGSGLSGHAFALTGTIGFAGVAVVARRGGGAGMLPMMCWGAAFTCIATFIACGGDVAVTWPDLITCVVSGGVLAAGGATCFMQGARYAPAGVLAFLSLTDVVLAPVWVWVGFGEVPSGLTLVGGAVVLGAILAEAAQRMRGHAG